MISRQFLSTTIFLSTTVPVPDSSCSQQFLFPTIFVHDSV